MNPEAVDVIPDDKVRIIFTNEDGDEVCHILLKRKDAWDLRGMIADKLRVRRLQDLGGAMAKWKEQNRQYPPELAAVKGAK